MEEKRVKKKKKWCDVWKAICLIRLELSLVSCWAFDPDYFIKHGPLRSYVKKLIGTRVLVLVLVLVCLVFRLVRA